jgi:hypothetical protein
LRFSSNSRERTRAKAKGLACHKAQLDFDAAKHSPFSVSFAYEQADASHH